MDGKKIEFEEFKLVAKSILKRVHDFCEENELKYFLAFGTLLGAVRHNDMIPWDYDIDIMMPREDFNKFLELTKRENVIENITVYSWLTHKNYYLPFIKVCDNRTRLVITKTTNPLPLGIWIDIFPIDGASNDMQENIEIQKEALVYTGKASAPYNVVNSTKEKIYKDLAIVNSYFHSSSSYIKKAHGIVTKYTCAESDNLALMISIDLPVTKEVFPKRCIEPLIKLPFGNYEFYCPSGYDEILTNIYGDYMQLPPEKDRAIPQIGSYWI